MSAPGPSHTESASGFRLAVEPRYAEAIRQEGLSSASGLDAALARAEAVPGGRGPNYLLESSAWPSAVRIRPALRGGWLGPLLGDRFRSPQRILREFERFRTLRAREVPLPRPAFAASVRRGLFWRAYLATFEESGTRNAKQWLEEPHNELEKIAAADALAEGVRALHDAGATHGDLHLGNLLLSAPEGDGAIRIVLLDLDRGQLHDGVAPSDRARDWMRLERSAEKLGLLSEITPRIRARLLSRYCAGDRSLRRAMLAALPREQRRIERHRLLWRRTRKDRIQST